MQKTPLDRNRIPCYRDKASDELQHVFRSYYIQDNVHCFPLPLRAYARKGLRALPRYPMTSETMVVKEKILIGVPWSGRQPSPGTARGRALREALHWPEPIDANAHKTPLRHFPRVSVVLTSTTTINNFQQSATVANVMLGMEGWVVP